MTGVGFYLICLLSLLPMKFISSLDLLPDETFIFNLLSAERLSFCSLVVLQDNEENGESADRLVASSQKAAYSVRFPNKSNMTADDLPLTFPKSVSNSRRMSDPCMVIILMSNSIQPKFMANLFLLLTPVFIPITRKDEDFYIFKTKPALHEKLLMMNELPSRIKFKIAVGQGEALTKTVKVSTVCFFCNTGGEPRLLQLPVAENSFPLAGLNYFPDYVWNLNGKVLQVSFPFVRAKIEADPPWLGTRNARRGNWKKLFEEFLMIRFNFTYHMFAATGKDGNPGGGGTGVQLPNGSWIGVTGDLISRKADLGVVIAHTPKRIHYIDYTDSFYDIGYLTFATAQPSRIFSPAALLWPFDLVMWLGIGAATFISIAFLFTAFQIMEKYKFGSGEKWSLSLQIQFILSTFLEQDSPVLPISIALRIFVALWVFFTMVLTTVYRSKMVTLLAFGVLGKLPQTFEQLAFSDYQVGFVKHGDAAYNTLAASKDPVYVKLVAEMEIFRGFGLECLEKVIKFKYACIAYDSSIVHMRERNMSESDTRKLVFAPARTYNIWLGLGTEGRSIYKKNFGILLSYTRPMHLADIWDEMDWYTNVRLLKLKWWKDTNQTEKTKHLQEESDDLTMKHIAGAFYVLFACLAMSSIVFVREIVSVRSGNDWYKSFLLRFLTEGHALTMFQKEVF